MSAKKCPNCGDPIDLSGVQPGEAVSCGHCGHKMTITLRGAGSDRIHLRCTCGKYLAVPKGFPHEVATCPACGREVPLHAPVSAGSPDAPDAAEDADTHHRADREASHGAAETRTRRHRRRAAGHAAPGAAGQSPAPQPPPEEFSPAPESESWAQTNLDEAAPAPRTIPRAGMEAWQWILLAGVVVVFGALGVGLSLLTRQAAPSKKPGGETSEVRPGPDGSGTSPNPAASSRKPGGAALPEGPAVAARTPNPAGPPSTPTGPVPPRLPKPKPLPGTPKPVKPKPGPTTPPATPPSTPPRPTVRPKSRVFGKWETPGWEIRRYRGKNPIQHMCRQIRYRETGTLRGWAGRDIGPKATGMSDPAYVKFRDQHFEAFRRGLKEAGGSVAPRQVSQPFGELHYDRVLAMQSSKAATAIVGIENGRCVAYWYLGSAQLFPQFTRLVGSTKQP